MGALRVIAYPFKYGYKDFGSAYRDSKRLARFYDIAKRIVIGLGAKNNTAYHYKILGARLMKEVESQRITLNRARLEGKEEVILEAVINALADHFAGQIEILPEINHVLSVLKQKNIIATPGGPKGRNTFPIKRAKALNSILETREGLKHDPISDLKSKHTKLQKQKDTLVKQMESELDRLNLGHKAYQEIMNAVYKSDPHKSLEDNITQMLNVITEYAWQVIGRSPKSEAAGWIVIGHDGKVGRKIRLWKVDGENKDLETAKIHTLKKQGSNGNLVMAEEGAPEIVADGRGNFIAAAEWETLQLREDLVAVQKKDGSRVLYKRNYKHGSELVGEALRSKGKKVTGTVAETIVGLIGKVAHFENAYVNLQEVTQKEAGLKKGEIVPYIVEGSVIKLVSAGSADPNLRQNKMAKGEKAQEKLGIGIIEQPLEKSVGNVRTSAIKPLALMISDVNDFNLREQNRFLISIVGVQSYFIRSLIEFDTEGNAIVLGSLEVTNPEVIPKHLNAADRKVLLEQFEMGKIFAGLASTGIMIKTLREEIDRLTLQYLGPQVYQIVKNRDFARLKGTKVDDATIMFADISGFTSLSDKLQDTPEQVVSLLSTMFAELTPLIIKNGGMVDKYIGDAIMADWGVTVKSAYDVQNAVMTAIEFQRRLQLVNDRPEMQAVYKRHGIPPLGISIGLNTGMAIAGNLGHEGSKIEFSVIGDAVNVAARLEGAASRGQIIIGERTFALLTDTFKVKFADEFNSYNRDIGKLKEFIMAEYHMEGKVISEPELDQKLQRYLKLYKEAKINDIFVPGVSWGKNKGAIPCFYVRWDKHAWRYQYLKAAGIEIGTKSTFENQPPTSKEMHAQIQNGPPANRQAMLDAYHSLIIKRT
jgi:class 3 adenylate cyclase